MPFIDSYIFLANSNNKKLVSVVRANLKYLSSMAATIITIVVTHGEYSWPFNSLSLNYTGALICRFSSINRVGSLFSTSSHLRIQPKWIEKVFLIHSLESMGVEGWLSALFYVILYMGLEHLQILVSEGVWEPTPYRYQGCTAVKLWESQSYTWIFNVQGLVPQPCCSRVNYT